MLPQTTQNAAVSPLRRIHINPNFQKTRQQITHINPLFLQTPTIHMNPKFLQQNIEQHQLQMQQLQLQESKKRRVEDKEGPTIVAPSALKTENARKVISKSRMCIIREPVKQKPLLPTNTTMKPATSEQQPLIRLTRNKLIRRPVLKTSSTQLQPTKQVVAKYKVDNRGKGISDSLEPTKTRHCGFVARYALRRATGLSPYKQKMVSRPLLKSAKSHYKMLTIPANKKLEFLNINGVLYKSTRNKLQRKESDNRTTIGSPINLNTNKLKSSKTKSSNCTMVMQKSQSPYGRTLFVRGTKFVMDVQGFRLTRVPSGDSSGISGKKSMSVGRQRIDIGGLTYVASKTHNVFLRTRNHLALAHLNSAKHRSLHLLTKRMVKSNVPCPIFKRLGKCMAHDRGKCNKVHDKMLVSICPRFLRSECQNVNCLLSHNVSLSKMPVCKFFLQGVCVRSDCPYLHKKLSSSTEICVDFLQGFCKLADQCKKRHEFVCPEYERNGKCKTPNCVYCKSTKRLQLRLTNKDVDKKVLERKTKENVLSGGDEHNAGKQEGEDDAQPTLRYFTGSPSEAAQTTDMTTLEVDEKVASPNAGAGNNSDVVPAPSTLSTLGARPKLGALPAFIPL